MYITVRAFVPCTSPQQRNHETLTRCKSSKFPHASFDLVTKPRTVWSMETTTNQHVESSITDRITTYPSGHVVSQMTTAPDRNTMVRAATCLDIDVDVARAAAEMLTSSRVAGVVFSGKMASGKDTVAEEVGHALELYGFAGAVVHRTSDPIRAELNESIAIIKSCSHRQAAVRELVELQKLPEAVASHLVDSLFEVSHSGTLDANQRTDLSRHLLQFYADEGRRAVDPDYWIKKFFGQVVHTLASGNSAVLSGCRYPNEILPAQALGIMTVRLEVSPTVQALRLGGRDGLAPRQELIENPNECALDDFAGFNLVVRNDTELEPTVAQVTTAVRSHLRVLAEVNQVR